MKLVQKRVVSNFHCLVVDYFACAIAQKKKRSGKISKTWEKCDRAGGGETQLVNIKSSPEEKHRRVMFVNVSQEG